MRVSLPKITTPTLSGSRLRAIPCGKEKTKPRIQLGTQGKEEKKRATYADTRRELNHLLSLDVLEAIDTGDTVTDREDTTSLLNVGLKGVRE